MGYKIDEIEGIGPAYRAKLATVDIQTTDDLLEHCCTPGGRKTISDRTGLSASTLLNWANMADLMRVSGIGRQYAELLEASGVDTIKELRNRNAENLSSAMKEINSTKKLARTSPSASVVQKWVRQAKAMAPRISH